MHKHSLSTGTILGGAYRILQPLAREALWTIYLANIDSIDDINRVALKVTDAGSLRPEARRLLGVTTGVPSIFPTIYEVFQDGPLSCMALEYIRGVSLYDYLFGADHIPGRGRLTKEAVIAIGVQLATAVAALHTRRSPLIFCGFSPANILLERQSGCVRLPDLSVARPPTTNTAYERLPALAIRGQEGYMPPEYDQVITPGTDIYGLGATLWVLLTGEESWRERRGMGNWSMSPLTRLLRSMVNEDPGRRPESMSVVSDRLSHMDRLTHEPKPVSAVAKKKVIPRRASAVEPGLAFSPPVRRMRPVPRRSGTWRHE